jgi:hypothetical protein
MARIAAPQRHLLLAALEAPVAALENFLAWCNLATLDDLRGPELRLLPLIYQNIGSQIPDPALKQRLRGIARHSWLQNQTRVNLCLSILDTLSARQIPVLLLKGTAIMALIGDAADLRVMGDCDLLVPNECAPEAFATLLDLGFRCEPGFAANRANLSDFLIRHAVAFGEPSWPQTRNFLTLIDLHWRPLVEVRAEEFAREFFDWSMPARLTGRAVRVPSIEHLFLQSVVHGTKWGGQKRFDWVADCLLIMRIMGAHFNWARLWGTAERFGLTAILKDALETLAETVTVPIASAVWRQPSGCEISSVEHREAKVRQKDPGMRSRVDWLAWEMQRVRREELQLSARPFETVLPILRDRLRVPSLPRSYYSNNPWRERFADSLWFLSGWSGPEAEGRWTECSLASLAVPTPDANERQRLVLSSLPFMAPGHPAQRADLYADGCFVTRLDWPLGSALLHRHIIDLPPPGREQDHMVLQFRIAHPGVPARYGINTDNRWLGFFLIKLSREWRHRRLTDGPIILEQGSADLDLLLHGWGVGERTGCWTTGASAALRWDGAIPRGARVAVTIAACFAPDSRRTTGRAFINNTLVKYFRFASDTKMPTDLLMRPPARQDSDMTVLRFEIDNPSSPAAFRLSDDARELGLFISRISLV